MAEASAQMNAEQNSGTEEVGERHKFDEAALTRWMEQNVEGFKGPLEVRKFKGGQSNPTFFLKTPSKNYVMRSRRASFCPAPTPWTANTAPSPRCTPRAFPCRARSASAVTTASSARCST
jgi:hypothetical protein